MVMRVSCVLTIAAVIGLGTLAQEASFRSGPQPAGKGQPTTRVPQSFQAHVFNGRTPERFRSVVCENDYFPTALFFLKEPPEGKEGALKSLLAKLDQVVPKYQAMEQYPEVAAFTVYAVFLSEAAQTSLNGAKEEDPAGLVKEATARRALYARMRDWAKDLKSVVVAVTVPESVKSYELNPKAGLTGIYYESFNVLENWAFPEGAFQDSDADAVIGRIEGRLKARIAELDAPAKKAPKK